MNTDKKVEALRKFLGVESEGQVFEVQRDGLFTCDSGEFQVLTDTEADIATYNYIKESVWAFRPEFLEVHTIDGVEADTIKILQEKCEDANAPLIRLISDFDHFVDDAIKADGRGHFLAPYDFEEGESNVDGEWFFIYRVN